MIETKEALLSGKNSKQKVQGSLVSEESQCKKQQHTNSCLQGRQLVHMAFVQGLACTPVPKAKESAMPVLETSFWQQHDEGYLV